MDLLGEVYPFCKLSIKLHILCKCYVIHRNGNNCKASRKEKFTAADWGCVETKWIQYALHRQRTKIKSVK